MLEANNYLPHPTVPGFSDLLVFKIRHWSRFWSIIPIQVPSVFLVISRLNRYRIIRSLLGSYSMSYSWNTWGHFYLTAQINRRQEDGYNRNTSRSFLRSRKDIKIFITTGSRTQSKIPCPSEHYVRALITGPRLLVHANPICISQGCFRVFG
jgi:hypothetical protein